MPAEILPPVVDTEVPTWKSPNELIHERINFDDTIWGFGLAGGAYYKTPLRITYVRPGSRAEKAHIFPGDVVLKINNIESSTLTLEEAHRMILESGIHLMINVTSPEDLEDTYHCYQDQLQEEFAEEGTVGGPKHQKTTRLPKFSGKCSHWSLQWPWKCKRKIIYKESNCYLVPSKYEEKHKDTRKPEVKQDDTIVLDSIYNVKGRQSAIKEKEAEENNNTIDTKKNDENKLNDNVVKNEVGSITEQHDTNDNDNDNKITNLNDYVNINDEHGIKEKNDSNDITEQIDSINKNDEGVPAEQNISVDNNNVSTDIEQNTAVDKITEDESIEKNNPLDKNNEDGVIDHNDPENKNDKDGAVENNISTDRNDENDVAEQTNKNKEEGINELNNTEEKNDNDDSMKQSDVIDKNKTNDENITFENSDIPGISESDKMSHNSR